MKRRIFWSVFFTVFFRLPICESIAAIFWQSASYVSFIIVELSQQESLISEWALTCSSEAIFTSVPQNTTKYIRCSHLYTSKSRLVGF